MRLLFVTDPLEARSAFANVAYNLMKDEKDFYLGVYKDIKYFFISHKEFEGRKYTQVDIPAFAEDENLYDFINDNFDVLIHFKNVFIYDYQYHYGLKLAFDPRKVDVKKIQYEPAENDWYPINWRRLLNMFDMVWFTNNYVREKVKIEVPSYTLYHGVDLDTFRKEKEWEEREYDFCTVQTNDLRKYFPILIHLAKEIKKKFYLHITGSVRPYHLGDWLSTLNEDIPKELFYTSTWKEKEYVHENVVLNLKKVTHKEMAKLYNECKVYVDLAMSEGFGVPKLEASACGATVVTMDTPVNREIMRGGAYYVKSYRNLPQPHGVMWWTVDINDLKKKMLKALEKPIEGNVKRYDWNLIRKRFRKLLKIGLNPFSR